MQAVDRFTRGHDGWERLKQLRRFAEIWFYEDGQKFETGTFESDVMGFMKTQVAAQYRRSVATKTRVRMRERVESGKTTGGRIFGYSTEGDKRSKVRVIREDEAKVVRSIFEQYAAGRGFKSIAHGLNAQGVPGPGEGRKRTSGKWDSGNIRSILR